ncbi:hypothetical protein [Gordonibacter sp. 28C]|uniref:hypothetical protein n=1 Tax=Gordonibacter sp. 28C TaxID=2078569 RepID=UPI0011C0521A|nr:hypothetical protein [Gordonibacter sp. 28C]
MIHGVLPKPTVAATLGPWKRSGLMGGVDRTRRLARTRDEPVRFDAGFDGGQLFLLKNDVVNELSTFL